MVEAEGKMSGQEGMIFDVKRFAIHDGPGIRTTVFLKGCNMTCWWCHNPESRSSARELFFYGSKCVMCRRCVEVCPNGVHSIVGQKHLIDHSKCVLCGRCVDACAYGALKIIGEVRSAGDVLSEVLEDKHYYEVSGGGLTVSGGEPMMQVDFAYALMKLARENGINTVLDTNGSDGRGDYEKILPVVDMFFVDIKQTDEVKSNDACGVGWSRVADNIRWLAGRGAKITLRCPIIPEFNAEDDEHWRKVAAMAKQLDSVVAIEYLAYHRLWISKSEGIGLDVDEGRRNLPEISPERIGEIENSLKESGKKVGKG